MNALTKQVGGNWYSKLAIQPMEFSLDHGLDAARHSAIKYITRYKDKGTASLDLHKAIHCLQILIDSLGAFEGARLYIKDLDKSACEYCELNNLDELQSTAIVAICSALSSCDLRSAIRSIEVIIEHEGFE